MNLTESTEIFLSFVQCNYRLFVNCSVRQKLLILPRYVWMLLICFYTAVPYVHATVALKPLQYFNEKLYFKVEGVLYSWVFAAFAHMFSSCGHTVREVGDDISQLHDKETLLLWNHVTTADLFVCTYVAQHHAGVSNRIMVIIFQAMKWVGLGSVFETHGDFFIFAGSETMLNLEKHLRNVYQQRDRKWLVLFPEGNLLWYGKRSCQRYAEKQGLRVPKHVLIPRTGAFSTILDTLPPEKAGKTIKYIIDVTIGYPSVPPDAINILFGLLPASEVHVLYRVFPASQMPNEPEKRKEWLFSIWEEKDKNLDYFYKHGEFPVIPNGEENGNCVGKKDRLLSFSLFYIICYHISLILLACAQFAFWGMLLNYLLEVIY